MTIECSLKDTHMRKRFRYLDCVVVTKTINYNDIFRPTQRAQRARNVWRFVISEYQRCDLVQHLAIACVANHVLPEPRRAAVEREAEIVKTVVPYQFRE